eukprot:5057743-Alexandrium_andersonii.AAC.1
MFLAPLIAFRQIVCAESSPLLELTELSFAFLRAGWLAVWLVSSYRAPSRSPLRCATWSTK